jgi:hypothetical protein
MSTVIIGPKIDWNAGREGSMTEMRGEHAFNGKEKTLYSPPAARTRSIKDSIEKEALATAIYVRSRTAGITHHAGTALYLVSSFLFGQKHLS